MEIYRISKKKYSSDLTASGNSGRWNYPGERVIYCAASRALAGLKVLIHTSGEMLTGTSFKISVIYFPDNLKVEQINRKELPADWNGFSSYFVTQPLGSRWLQSGGSALLKVPSSIIVNEINYIINVNHPDFKKIKIIDVEDYICDPRLIEKMNDR